MKYDESLIDPEIRKLKILGKMLPAVFTNTRTIKLFNKLDSIMLQGKCKIENVIYEQRWITRKDGKRLRICIYKPKNATGNLPGLLWIHGGGYAIGLPEMDQKFISNFLETADCVIVAPDYRLSVSEPYPAALDDCYAALLWMKHNTEKLGIRSNQIMVGGESAGGGLAAALTLYVRDKGNVNISFQIPLYPMIDDRMITKSSQNNYYPVWNSKMNYKGWSYYLGSMFQTNDVPKYAAPARETDYSNLPPACTFIGSLEPFRDEAIAYIEGLKEAGVDTFFHEYQGCYHGFDKIGEDSKIGREATRFLLDTFKYAIENYFSEQPPKKK
ncbi:alpha/beta hydrolase [[Clostridium] polysaccharolyticum]|uniref:alpha/beta hydrolase n=1 Tax=[Clostridium] polysaccharolyticum TaxID=29364 RepID=UPI0015A504C8|nr:alpha/beta hydrolase [[Clostridium] polysaccharolyticum]